MPKILIVGNEEFEFPEEGDSSGYAGGWGESVTSWAEAVTKALETVQQPNDIPISTAPILNNVTTPTLILGFAFDTSEVISIQGEYIVKRSTDTANLVENGNIEGNYNGSDWFITHTNIRDAGIVFDITTSGQIVYTTTNISGANYSGVIIFKAKVFNNNEE